MSITDELREWAKEHLSRNSILAIADRIDAEHEKAIRELNNLADAIADSCVQLPKDTGGEYIHEHDKVDWRDHAGTWHENATVVAVCNDGCYVMDGTVFHVHKSDIRHHHKPTVEDVLREFGERYCDTVDGCAEESELFAEYAAKLQLRGDGE